jgi:Flp pilus assembly pilin Flp
MVEYLLLVALIALAVIGAAVFLSGQLNSKASDAGNKVADAGGAAGCNPGVAVMRSSGARVAFVSLEC